MKKSSEKSYADLNDRKTTGLKNDGTPDLRTKVGKEISVASLVSQLLSLAPHKKDGTLDMRYAVNKGSSSVSSLTLTSSSKSAGPLKSDGTPDMRSEIQ